MGQTDYGRYLLALTEESRTYLSDEVEASPRPGKRPVGRDGEKR